MVFICWQLKKIFFMVLGGPNGALGAFWLILGQKRLFLTKFHKIPYFLPFFRLVYTPKYFKPQINALKENSMDKNCKKGVQNLQKWLFFVKNISFLIKKSCRIQINAPNRLKYDLKWSDQNTLDDPWCPQTIFSKLGCRSPHFCLLVKNGTPEAAGRVYWAFPNLY